MILHPHVFNSSFKLLNRPFFSDFDLTIWIDYFMLTLRKDQILINIIQAVIIDLIILIVVDRNCTISKVLDFWILGLPIIYLLHLLTPVLIILRLQINNFSVLWLSRELILRGFRPPDIDWWIWLYILLRHSSYVFILNFLGRLSPVQYHFLLKVVFFFFVLSSVFILYLITVFWYLRFFNYVNYFLLGRFSLLIHVLI